MRGTGGETLGGGRVRGPAGAAPAAGAAGAGLDQVRGRESAGGPRLDEGEDLVAVARRIPDTETQRELAEERLTDGEVGRRRW